MRALEILVGMALMLAGWFSLAMIYFAETNQILWSAAALILLPIGAWFSLED